MLKEIWSEFRREPLLSLNPQETDPAGTWRKLTIGESRQAEA
jgi:hypothetical protein